MRKGVLLGVMLVIVLVGRDRVCGQSKLREARRARGAELRRLLRAVDGADKEPARTFRTPDGYIRFLSAPLATRFRAEPGTAEEQADAFITTWRNIFVNESPAVAFEQKRVKTANGRTYIRYHQIYAGLEVFGAEMIIQVSGQGGIEAVINDIMRDTEALDTEELSTNPTIDAPTALLGAVDFMANQYEWLQFEATPPELMIYSPLVVGNSGPPRLVWRTEVGNLGELLAKDLILVDAHSGESVFHYSLICASLSRQITDSKNTSSTADDVVYPEQRNNWPYDPPETVEVELAYDYLEDIYWFYVDHHGRDSWNDQGADLLADVRCPGLSYPAEWTGTTIRVQAGSVTDDTFGHEFTHGVIQTEWGGCNYGESGAIMESLCDTWGEWIDLENGVDRDGYPDDPDDKWELWEDDTTDPPDKRNLKNPPDHNCVNVSGWGCDRQHPDYYMRPGYWYAANETSAMHFIHHNCGVGNKLAYLLCDGTSGEDNGEFNGETITGLGMPDTNELDASDLYYECQCHLLTSSTDYHDLAYALMLAASNLEFTAEEQEDVVRACRAVEIYSGNCAFSIQDSSGARVAWFDDLGNLFVAGRVFEEGQQGQMEAHWKLDETSGTTASDSVGSNDGTLSGCEWTNDPDRGWSLDFDGDDDYVSLSAVDALKGDNVTISAWINADNPTYTYSVILRQTDPSYNGYDLSIAEGTAPGQPSFYSGPSSVVRGVAINADEWYHLVGTYDGEHLRIYVDGRMSEAFFVGDNGRDTGLYMGWGVWAGNKYFEGTIDDARVYNYALSHKELRDLPEAEGDETVFRIEDSLGETVVRFDASGYLFLEGSVHAEEEPIDPPETTDNFVITDSSGEPVAYIDHEGELWLAGKLYE